MKQPLTMLLGACVEALLEIGEHLLAVSQQLLVAAGTQGQHRYQQVHGRRARCTACSQQRRSVNINEKENVAFLVPVLSY